MPEESVDVRKCMWERNLLLYGRKCVEPFSMDWKRLSKLPIVSHCVAVRQGHLEGIVVLRRRFSSWERPTRKCCHHIEGCRQSFLWFHLNTAEREVSNLIFFRITLHPTVRSFTIRTFCWWKDAFFSNDRRIPGMEKIAFTFLEVCSIYLSKGILKRWCATSEVRI